MPLMLQEKLLDAEVPIQTLYPTKGKVAARRGAKQSYRISNLTCPTWVDGGFENIGELCPLSNAKPGAEKEKPGAREGATGQGPYQTGNGYYYRSPRPGATLASGASA